MGNGYTSLKPKPKPTKYLPPKLIATEAKVAAGWNKPEWNTPGWNKPGWNNWNGAMPIPKIPEMPLQKYGYTPGLSVPQAKAAAGWNKPGWNAPGWNNWNSPKPKQTKYKDGNKKSIKKTLANDEPNGYRSVKPKPKPTT